MADQNTIIKDGIGNQFNLRSKDLLADTTLRRSMVLATAHPVDWGTTGGCYAARVKSGSMAAGLAANAPILMFRHVSTANVCLVRRVRFGAWSLGTGFAAGIASFALYAARNFTIEDSGGLLASISGNYGKLRTTMNAAEAVIRYSDTATLTAGTRTLDLVPLDGIDAAVGTTTNAQILLRTDMWAQDPHEHPLALSTNEGFIIQATVPATGVWAFAASVEWDAVPTLYF